MSGGGVGKYDTNTGAVMNANFITTIYPTWAIPLSGNNLFVASARGCMATGIVGGYNAITGAVFNANFITGAPNGRARMKILQETRSAG